MIVAIVWGLSILGVNATAVLAGVGIIGLILGFGAQSLIEDIITGAFIIFENQYSVGDVIILDDFRGLSNSEMLEIQMRKFREELDNAMRKGVKKIVFIHGVGAGVLKLEIRKELDRMKKKLDYQDASFKEYGYGATLVRIF